MLRLCPWKIREMRKSSQSSFASIDSEYPEDPNYPVNCLPTQPNLCNQDAKERVTLAVGDACPMLPKPEDLSKEPIYWGDGSVSKNIGVDIQCAYDEVVRWKCNLFMVSTGKVGDSFVSELSRLYREGLWGVKYDGTYSSGSQVRWNL